MLHATGRKHSRTFRPRLESLEDRRLLATRVVTIGDSWASYIANGAPGSIADSGTGNSMQTVLNTFGTGAQVYNGGFYGGTAAGHATSLAQITANINAAGPDADLVYLSSGGNDMLLGSLAGGWFLDMSPGAASALYASITANIQTVVNHILSIRPDIQIVIASYDYPNFYDFDLSNGGAAQVLRANYHLGFGGTGFLLHPVDEFPRQQGANAAFRAQEQGKIDIAANSRRVHHVYNYGIINALDGYEGYFGTVPAGLPQSTYDDWPIDKDRLGGGGTDPIHLDTIGYNALALNTYNNFLNTALLPGALSLSTGALTFGNVRVGTSAALDVTGSNVGPNFTKVKNLSFGAAGGDFSGGGQAFNPLFKDPTLGSDTATVTYSYTPSTRGADSQNLSVTSSNGSPPLALSGTGVGPVFSGASSLAFGNVAVGTSASLSLGITNATTDGNLGNLTNMTILSAQITGADASDFTLTGFTPGMVVAAGSAAGLGITFDAALPYGLRNATLTLVTDVGAAFGSSGQVINIPLSAFAAIDGPTAAIAAAAAAQYRGETVTYTLSASDPYDPETGPYTWDIDWDNNGTWDQTVSGPSGTTVTHAYTTNGARTIAVRATDPQLETGPTSLTNVTVGTYVARFNGSTTDLWWGGTPGNDATYFLSSSTMVTIVRQFENGVFSVAINVVGGINGRIRAFGYEGVDVLDAGWVSSRVTQLYGGEGNDNLYGGSRGDSLFGGNGDDLLVGGLKGTDLGDRLFGEGGHDVLFGYLGPDTLDGGAGEDLLVGDFFDFSAFGDYATLTGTAALWASGDSYENRVAALLFDTLLPTETVINDGAVDRLTGGADLDWLFYTFGQDLALDPEAGEEETDAEP